MAASTLYTAPYIGATIANPVNVELVTQPEEWLIKVAKGDVQGHSVFGSFGERVNVAVAAAGEDVWPGTIGLIPHPNPAGQQMAVSSSSGDDAIAGPGVQKVMIGYLDASGVQQTEIVEMSGVTPKNTNASDIAFINFVHSVQGAGVVAVGNITVHQVGTPATVYNMIALGGNMSLSCISKVPAGKTLYIVQWYATQVANKPTTLRLRSTDREGILYPDIFLFKEAFYLDGAPLSDWISPPQIIPENSVVKVSAWAKSTAGNVSAGFRGILVDN